MHCDHSMTQHWWTEWACLKSSDKQWKECACVCVWVDGMWYVPVSLSILQQVQLMPLGLQFGSTGNWCCKLLGLWRANNHTAEESVSRNTAIKMGWVVYAFSILVQVSKHWFKTQHQQQHWAPDLPKYQNKSSPSVTAYDWHYSSHIITCVWRGTVFLEKNPSHQETVVFLIEWTNVYRLSWPPPPCVSVATDLLTVLTDVQ